MSLIVYTPGRNDILLVSLYYEIAKAGDLDKLFSKRNREFSTLLNLAQPPTVVWLGVHDVPWFVAWLDPVFDGASFGTWIAPSMRRTKTALSTIIAVYEAAFERVPVLTGITWQADLLALHRKLGYSIAGPIPHLFDGKPAWMVWLTKEAFEQWQVQAKARSSAKRVNGRRVPQPPIRGSSPSSREPFSRKRQAPDVKP